MELYGMNMENIERKIHRIRDYIDILNTLRPECIEKIKTDKIIRGSVIYYLYILSDSCITLAEMIIKHKSLPKPQTYFEAIEILGENKIIPADFAYDFAKISGFRNFLAHDYEKIDYVELCTVMMDKLNDVEKFLKYIEEDFGIFKR